MSSIFSRILEGELPASFVYRDSESACFMSINPIVPGHALVVPVLEIDHWVDLPTNVAGHLFGVAHRIAAAMMQVHDCDRIGMIIAGYEVNHCHIHLIPSRSMSDFDFSRAAGHVDRESLEIEAGRIRSALA